MYNMTNNLCCIVFSSAQHQLWLECFFEQSTCVWWMDYTFWQIDTCRASWLPSVQNKWVSDRKWKFMVLQVCNISIIYAEHYPLCSSRHNYVEAASWDLLLLKLCQWRQTHPLSAHIRKHTPKTTGTVQETPRWVLELFMILQMWSSSWIDINGNSHYYHISHYNDKVFYFILRLRRANLEA